MPRALFLLPVLVAPLLMLPTQASAADPVLDQPRHGADAIRALGDRLNGVAAAHATTPDLLRERLRTDPSLWVDATGRLFYVDAAPAATEATAGPTVVSSAHTSTPGPLELQSRPGAARTIHLDFDGVGGSYGSSIGGAWSTRTYTGGDGVAEPYSLDADASTSFSAAELLDIRSIWQRVAEDFAPFDVNVTTLDPGHIAIDRSGPDDLEYGTRVAMTSSANSCGCGGVAYVGVFDHDGASGRSHAYYQPAFVYNRGAKNAAEAATHEAGHNLGLSHDGTGSTGYYEGHGHWAPIMGVGYYEPVSQWSRGEYAGANNTENDFAVAVDNGAPVLPDEPSSTAIAADGSPQAGVINAAVNGQPDVDVYSFSLTADGSVGVDVAPAAVSPNLDVHVTLRRVDGGAPDELLGDPAAEVSRDVATGLGGFRAVDLAAGTYEVRVAGAAFGSPATTGYSSYGSVGPYTVRVGPAVTPLARPAATEPTNASVAGTSISVGWLDVANEAGFEVERRTSTGTYSASFLLPAGRTSLDDSPGTGTWIYRVRAANGAGAADWSAFTAPLTTARPKGRK